VDYYSSSSSSDRAQVPCNTAYTFTPLAEQALLSGPQLLELLQDCCLLRGSFSYGHALAALRHMCGARRAENCSRAAGLEAAAAAVAAAAAAAAAESAARAAAAAEQAAAQRAAAALAAVSAPRPLQQSSSRKAFMVKGQRGRAGSPLLARKLVGPTAAAAAAASDDDSTGSSSSSSRYAHPRCLHMHHRVVCKQHTCVVYMSFGTHWRLSILVMHY
jgi:pyruvate/2-oxoglutarate dehydrogenase complex dihydrolipoamide acyltransferase (E2) component